MQNIYKWNYYLFWIVLMSRMRDALFEPPNKNDSLFNDILQTSEYFGLPVSMVMHGEYGCGKTRFLKGIEACAIERKIPCTFFHTSQYDSDKFNPVNSLIVKMGTYYRAKMEGEFLRAKIIGTIAATLDSMLKFIGRDFSILETKDAIVEGIEDEEAELFGDWIKLGDPIEGLKSDFAKMVCDVTIKSRKEIKWEYTIDVPWIILFDDLDRLLPEAALNLILSLRVLLSSIDTDTGTPVPALFLFSLNTNCLRDAVRCRYANITKDEIKQTEFTEQFIRKYFVFGPRIPSLTKDSIASQYEMLVPEKNITDRFLDWISLANLSYRTTLSVLDRIEFLLKSKSNFEITEVRFCILFLLELLRYNSEYEFFSIIQSEINRKGISFSFDVFTCLKDSSVKSLIEAILKNDKNNDIKTDTNAWKQCIVFLNKS